MHPSSPRISALCLAAFLVACGGNDKANTSPTDTAHDARPQAGTVEPGPSSPSAGADSQAEGEAAIAIRDRVLEIGFVGASKFPLDPHHKNRSRAQKVVLDACIALDRDELFVRFVDQIQDWRRGQAYAEMALRLIERGDLESDTQRVDDYLTRAEDISETVTSQEWRRHAVLAAIARARRAMGQAEESSKIERGLSASETVEGKAQRATAFDAEQADAFFASLETVATAGNFDEIQGALRACVQVHDRFYGDDERRDRAANVVLELGKKMPRQVYVETVLDLAANAAGHADRDEAVRLLRIAEAAIDEVMWEPRFHVPLLVRLGTTWLRIGDADQARKEIEGALANYEEARDTIADIYRCETLCSVAEAYHALGDSEKALELYRRALEEAVVNPNSRPRADDLAFACASIALSGPLPDDALIRKLERIRDGLGDPW
jgi:tetratricopeptide (TPR) repeat protein